MKKQTVIIPKTIQNKLLSALHKQVRAHEADVQAYGSLVSVVKEAIKGVTSKSKCDAVCTQLVRWAKAGKYNGFALQSLRNAINEAKPQRFKNSAKASKQTDPKVVKHAEALLKRAKNKKAKAIQFAKEEYRIARMTIRYLTK